MSSTLEISSHRQNSLPQKYRKVIKILQSQNIQVLLEQEVQSGSNSWDIICQSDRRNYVLQHLNC